jgi:hypothetical protein
MVNKEWMEEKIIRLEHDLTDLYWSDVREKQLNYLINLHRTGDFTSYSIDQINERLITIFHGYES